MTYATHSTSDVHSKTSAQVLALKKDKTTQNANSRGTKRQSKDKVLLSEQQHDLFSYYFFEAQRCLDMNKYDDCLEYLNYCLTLNGQDPETNSMLGLIYGALQAQWRSEKHLYRAMELAPTEWRYRKNYVSALYNTDDADKKNRALEIAKEATKINPDEYDMWETLLTIYTNRQDYKNMIKCLNEMERLEGRTANSVLAKFKAYLSLGKEKKGIEEIESFIKDYPEEYRMQCIRGDIYMMEGKTEEAYEIYQHTLAEHPENPYIYTSIALYYSQLGNKELATKTVVDALNSKYLDLSGKMTVLQNNINILENNEIDIEPLLKNMIEQYPLEEMVHGFYAQYLHNHNRLEEEQVILQTMTDINPDNEQTWHQMFDYALNQKNDSLINDIADRAIKAQPDKPDWYFYKAAYMVRDSAFAEAKATSEKGLSITSDDNLTVKLAFYRQLGDINSLLGDFDEVYRNYDAALALSPQDTYVLNNYAYMLAINGGDLKKAEKMSAKTIEAEPTNATFLDTYAWILYLQGSKTLARFYIDRAMEYAKEDQDNSEIKEHYKIIYSE